MAIFPGESAIIAQEEAIKLSETTISFIDKTIGETTYYLGLHSRVQADTRNLTLRFGHEYWELTPREMDIIKYIVNKPDKI